jgi:hypothetical protein
MSNTQNQGVRVFAHVDWAFQGKLWTIVAAAVLFAVIMVLAVGDELVATARDDWAPGQ